MEPCSLKIPSPLFKPKLKKMRKKTPRQKFLVLRENETFQL